MFTKRKSLLLGFLAAATATGLALGVNGVVDAYVGEPVEVSAAGANDIKIASFDSDDVIKGGSSYKAYSNSEWGITFGGGGKSLGTNDNNNNISKCILPSKYYTGSLDETVTAAAFYNVDKLENVSTIEFSYESGAGNSTAISYLLYSSDDTDYVLAELSGTGLNQGGDIGDAGSLYTYNLSSPLTGYFAVVFAATPDTSFSKGFKFNNITADFYSSVVSVYVSNIEVSSTSDSVLKNMTLQMNAVVSPDDASSKNVEWSVSPSDLASIDQDGLLRGLSEGVVTVTATAQDGSGVSGSKTIAILPNNSELHYFGEHSSFENWGSKYTEHTLQYDKFSIKFTSANKQGSDQAITDCPVSKGSFAVLTAKDGFLIKSVEFGFKQWTDKTQTTDLLVSNDGTDFGKAVASIDFPADGTSISYADEVGFKAVKISHSNSNQIGWDYVNIELFEDTGASDFAKTFLGEKLCDDGLTAPSVETWNTLAASFNEISAASKETFKTADANVSGTEIEQCVARYDYIVGKYGAETYNDFMDRKPAQIASALSIRNSDDIMDIAVISALAVAGIAAAGAFVFLRRKKEA